MYCCGWAFDEAHVNFGCVVPLMWHVTSWGVVPPQLHSSLEVYKLCRC
jgi:hypothetical protein